MNIFLDFDGTVLDSRKRLHVLFTDLTNAAISFDEYWEIKRNRNSNQWILKNQFHFDENKIEKFTTDWMQKIEAPNYLLLDELFPFSKNALEALALKGNLHLITGRQSRENLMQQLAHFSIAKYFQTIMNTENKIEKEVLIKKNNFILSSADIFVGDTGKDIESGKTLGIRTIAVLSGFRNKSVLDNYNPDYIVESLNQVSELI